MAKESPAKTYYREQFRKSRAGGKSPGLKLFKSAQRNRIEDAAHRAGKAQRQQDGAEKNTG